MSTANPATQAKLVRSIHPISFSLLNDDEQPVMHILDGPDGQNLKLKITNRSTVALKLPAKTAVDPPKATKDQHHFELRFRPGVLDTTKTKTPITVTPGEGGWLISEPSQTNGIVSLYLLSTNADAHTLAPDSPITLTLQNVSIDGHGGARGTKVELRFPDLLPDGQRVQHMSIVNERGHKYIPLHVGIVGSNKILNDGTGNTLTLRITNLSTQSSIQLDPKNDDQFTLSFDSSKTEEWALAPADDVNNIHIEVKTDGDVDSDKPDTKPVHFKITPVGEGQSKLWHITPLTPVVRKPGEHIDVTLSGIVSSLPSGPANLYLHYEIAGYWDGDFVCVIEKGPVVYKEQNVGIGTNDPKSKLQVMGSILASGDVQTHSQGAHLEWNKDGHSGMTYLLNQWGLGSGGLVFGKVAPDGTVTDQVHIDPAGNVGIGNKLSVAGNADFSGNVGIGTTDPKQPLTVPISANAKGISLGSYDLLAAGQFAFFGHTGKDGTFNVGNLTGGSGNGNGSAGMALVHTSADDKNTNTELAFVTHNYRVDSCEKMRINRLGHVGIGTDNPKAQLDVRGAANIWAGEAWAVPNGKMAPGSLTIGGIKRNYGGGIEWNNNNPAGLLLETLDNTEIAVHDAGTRLASLMYYEGGNVNRLTIGREMDPKWGALSTLSLNGNVGIGTVNPSGFINAGPYFKPDQSGRNVDILSASNESVLNLLSGQDADSAHIGGVYFSRTGGQLDAHRQIAAIQVRQVGTGTLAGGKLLFFTKPNGSGIGVDDARMVIDNNGNVGIATPSPGVPLDVAGSTRGSFVAWKSHYLNFDGTGSDLSAYATQNISIRAAQAIVAQVYFTSSDARMKNVEGRSNGAADLATLSRIEITDYTLKDVVASGSRPHKKVIAQDLENVYPQAVSKSTAVVPDIYQPAPFMDGWIDLATDLKVGERVRLMSDKTEGIYEVLEVATDKFRTDFKPEGDKVFVFGREVDDFRTLDYDAISMLNVSATQQLKKEKDEEVNLLRAEITDLKSANDALQKRLALLESKFETAVGVVVAKNGSNGNGTH